jgi:3-phenylpropionate/trans-cinnamate dioxygenase ferredoxin reductase component
VQDRVVAGMNVGIWDVTDGIQRLLRARVPVTDSHLADPDIPHEDLAPTAEAGAA